MARLAEYKFNLNKWRDIMITTRDIKVFIISVLFSTVCFALFNQSIKEAEAQGGKGARGLASVAPQEIYDLLQAHITGAIANHTQTRDLLQAHISGAIANHTLTQDRLAAHISGAIANHTLTQDRIEAHISGAVAKHAEMLEKLDALLAR